MEGCRESMFPCKSYQFARHRERWLSRSPIIVLDPDNIVLAEIAAGLHLDQLQQNLAGIFQPVHGADRDIDLLVLAHGLASSSGEIAIDRWLPSPDHEHFYLPPLPDCAWIESGLGVYMPKFRNEILTLAARGSNRMRRAFQKLKRLSHADHADSESGLSAAVARDPNSLPDIVQIESAMACNLRCLMCPVPTSKVNMDGRNAGIMKLDTYKEIIRQISDRPRTIGLTIMGEPLINKRIIDFVQIGKAAGHTMALTTNATLLTEQTSAGLLSAGLDSIAISFDGAEKATFERIRIGAKYETVVANVKRHFELRNKLNPRSQIHLHCIVSDLTRTQQEAFRTMWAGIADHIAFLTLDDWNGQMEIPTEFGFVEHAIPALEQPPVGCDLLWNVVSFSNNGEPIYCCNDYKLHSKLPSIFEQPIAKTWATEIAQERARHAGNAVDGGPCLECARWKRIKIQKERAATWTSQPG
jgi:organic radical activating enzyme